MPSNLNPVNKNIKFHITALMDAYMFRECIAFVRHGLEQNGYEVTYADNQLSVDAINIVFASHCNAGCWLTLSQQSTQIIVYNWEPASPMIGRFNQAYIRLMQHVHVWDYSTKNVAELRNIAGVEDIHYLPMGYAPSMTTLSHDVVQDIDVLFYGTITERRRKIINELRAKGLYVLTSEDVGQIQDDVRDELIKRSKVLLNVHVYDFVQIFEVARVSLWLANKKAVVTEVSEETEIAEDLKAGMACGKLEELAQLCEELVRNEQKRLELAQKGFEVFSHRSAADLMQTAVDRYLMQKAKNPPQLGNSKQFIAPLPKVAQLGCGSVKFIAGEQWSYSHFNIDERSDFSPDWAFDLNRALPFAHSISTWRFGRFVLSENYFDKIIAVHFLPRARNLQQVLTNCLKLLREDGTLHFSIPLDLSLESHAHVNDRYLFNEKTIERLLENWWQYGWETHRFVLHSTGVGIVPSNTFAFGFFEQTNGDWDTALKTARVIDRQEVVLRKCALSLEEQKMRPKNRFMS